MDCLRSFVLIARQRAKTCLKPLYFLSLSAWLEPDPTSETTGKLNSFTFVASASCLRSNSSHCSQSGHLLLSSVTIQPEEVGYPNTRKDGGRDGEQRRPDEARQRAAAAALSAYRIDVCSGPGESSGRSPRTEEFATPASQQLYRATNARWEQSVAPSQRQQYFSAVKGHAGDSWETPAASTGLVGHSSLLAKRVLL